MKKSAYQFYTHNEIRPEGWMRRQLEIQAQGLAGNLDKVWPDVRESKWIGGDREGWERVPYWLDGFIPLAYLLDDQDMIGRAKKYIDGILARQEEDGWICPCTKEERRQYDVWAVFLIGKVLTMYADLSGEEQAAEAVYRMYKNLDEYIKGTTIDNWAMYRWYEGLISLFWLYDRYPEAWILRMIKRLSEQGFDYTRFLEHFSDKEPVNEWTFCTHVVNLAMAIKQDALMTRLYGGDPDSFAKKMIDTLIQYHGMAVGHFTGDECLSGDSPVQGSELCSVVEAMYSYEQLLSISGNPMWGDYLERLAFNALPATVSKDMWTHQYDQQTNQVRCELLPKDHIVFRTNYEESNLFGLEPNFGCCTANMGQGFPKFMMSAFLHNDSEIYNAALIPGTLNTSVNGQKVRVALRTDYPFKNTLNYTVEADGADFALRIRVPSWARDVKVTGIDGAVKEDGSLLINRVWNGRLEFTVSFAFDFEFKARPNDMAALWYGPLLFSVPVKAEYRMLEYERNGVVRKFPYCDYELIPTSPWNYAFKKDTELSVETHDLGEFPFDSESPAVTVKATMVKIDWQEAYKVAKPAPESREPIASPEEVTLIPYGMAKLRMTEMPLI